MVKIEEVEKEITQTETVHETIPLVIPIIGQITTDLIPETATNVENLTT